ncbi:transposase [Mesorhizobium sp. ORM16]|uniref:transposase n=1 Tax=Mesorhizobium sp. ORM16 TaxID=3376989 RepID=UPI0038571AF8
MKKTRYTEQQIAFALRYVESGTPVAQAIRKMGITEPAFFRCLSIGNAFGFTSLCLLGGTGGVLGH